MNIWCFLKINLGHYKVLDPCLNCMNVLHEVYIQYDNNCSLLLVCVGTCAWERVTCFMLPILIMFPPYNLRTHQFQNMATLWKSINGINEGEMTSQLALYFVAMYCTSQVLWALKVCGPFVDTSLYWTPTFEWFMARFVIKNGMLKRHVVWRDWPMCSKY